MNRSDVSSYLDSELGESKYTAQGLKFNCPKCSTINKYNLELNLNEHSNKYLIFHCWSCHYKGHLKYLLTAYAKDTSWKRFKELQDTYSIDYSKHAEKHEKELPVTIPYYLSEEVKFYLNETRNLHDVVLQERRILYCYSKEDEQFYDKIIFPFYENNKFIGFSTHDFKAKRYSNQRSLNFVPYRDLINPNYPIIITEGIYDALSVPNGIPMLGTKPSNELYKFAKGKKIILAVDNEVSIDEKKEIIDKFLFYGTNMALVFDLKNYKDLNEYRAKDQEELKSELKTIFELLILN